jgi:PAS domain S-box-containing protein
MVEIPLEAPDKTPLQHPEEEAGFDFQRQAVEELGRDNYSVRRPNAAHDGPLILVVEDNPDMNGLLTEILCARYRVVTALDGKEGLEKALWFRPDLILCDVMMPRMSGDKMVRELRKYRSMDEVPIVVLTAKADDELRVELLKEGAQDYLNKPLTPEEIMAKVERLIADRRRSAEELRKWKHVFDHSGFGMAVLDASDGTIQAANPAFARMHGYSVGELLGRPISRVFPTDALSEVSEHIRLGDEKGHHVYESTHLRKDGAKFPVLTDITAFKDGAGDVVYRAAYFQDMSERKRIEEILQSSERLASIGRLAATLTHEINNPLEAATMTIGLLQQQLGFEESTRRYLKIAQEELARIAQITKNTMGFYRESAVPVPVKLSEILDSVLELYSRKIRFDDITIEKRYDFRGEVQAFPGEMRQVFSNLVRNALEAVRQGGVVRVHVFTARDWTQPSRRGIRVTIADDGVGINPEHRSKLFAPFFTTKGEKGTGIGLWVTSGIVRKHGGAIRVRSSIEKKKSGTIFSVFLPTEVTLPKHPAETIVAAKACA